MLHTKSLKSYEFESGLEYTVDSEVTATELINKFLQILHAKQRFCIRLYTILALGSIHFIQLGQNSLSHQLQLNIDCFGIC